MRKYKMKLTNAVSTAQWDKVKLTHVGNHTPNSTSTPAMFKRECDEYDAGVLPFEHEKYLGDTYE